MTLLMKTVILLLLINFIENFFTDIKNLARHHKIIKWNRFDLKYVN